MNRSLHFNKKYDYSNVRHVWNELSTLIWLKNILTTYGIKQQLDLALHNSARIYMLEKKKKKAAALRSIVHATPHPIISGCPNLHILNNFRAFLEHSVGTFHSSFLL